MRGKLKKYYPMETKEYRFETEINQQQLESISTDPSALLDIISKEELDKLSWFIFDVLGDKDGSPEVGNIQVSSFKYDAEKNKGTFRMQFDIDRKFCCSDLGSCSNDYLDFNFNIENNFLVASGNYFDWTLNN